MEPNVSTNSNETKADPPQTDEVESKGKSTEKPNSNKLADIFRRVNIAVKFKLSNGIKKNNIKNNIKNTQDTIKSKTAIFRPSGPKGRRLPTTLMGDGSNIVKELDSSSAEEQTTEAIRESTPSKVAKRPPGKKEGRSETIVEKAEPLPADQENTSTHTANLQDKSPFIPNQKNTDGPKEQTQDSSTTVDEIIKRDIAEVGNPSASSTKETSSGMEDGNKEVKSSKSSRFDTSRQSESESYLEKSKSYINFETCKLDVGKIDSIEDTNSVKVSSTNEEICCNEKDNELILNQDSQNSKTEISNSTTTNDEAATNSEPTLTAQALSDPTNEDSEPNRETIVFFNSIESSCDSSTPTETGNYFLVRVNSKRSPIIKAVSMQTDCPSPLYKNKNKMNELSSHPRRSKSNYDSLDSVSKKEPPSIDSPETHNSNLSDTKTGDEMSLRKILSLPLENTNMEQISDLPDTPDPDKKMINDAK